MDFIFLGSKTTADGDCSHEIKRQLLFRRKDMMNLDSLFLKKRERHQFAQKAMVFPVVMYGCGSWTIKKTEHQTIDGFELWCWRGPLLLIGSVGQKMVDQWTRILVMQDSFKTQIQDLELRNISNLVSIPQIEAGLHSVSGESSHSRHHLKDSGKVKTGVEIETEAP